VVAGTLFLRNPASLAPAADRASDRLKTVARQRDFPSQSRHRSFTMASHRAAKSKGQNDDS
jgi:hypothetical protein